MSLNNFSYNNNNPNVQGFDTLKPLNTVKPAQNTNNTQQPVNGIANDYVRVNNLSKSNMSKTPSINFSQVNLSNVDSAINHIITNNPDPNQKASQLRDLMTSLLDDEDFNAAIKVINATDSPLYKNAMFKGLIQELVAAGLYNPALNLLNHFPDKRIQNEMRDYISGFINEYRNDSGLAAKFQGDESFLNVTKLKAQNIIGSVGNFFSNIGNSVSSTFSKPSTATNLARSAESIVGKRYRYDFLDGGNLACAYTVSQALKGVKGLEGVSSNECNQLASMLSKKGFTKAYSNGNKPIQGKVEYKPGDIVFFTRKNKQGYGHVGIVAEVRNGVPYMVHNSSSKREVVKVRLDQYYKVPVAVFRSGK